MGAKLEHEGGGGPIPSSFAFYSRTLDDMIHARPAAYDRCQLSFWLKLRSVALNIGEARERLASAPSGWSGNSLVASETTKSSGARYDLGTFARNPSVPTSSLSNVERMTHQVRSALAMIRRYDLKPS